VALILTGNVPTAAFAAAEKVRTLVPDPGAPMLDGAKVAVTPVGRAVVENVTAELNPPTRLLIERFTVPELPPCCIDKLVWSPCRVKLGSGVTFTATREIIFSPPPDPASAIV
jgi:hypothetical protein